MTAPLRTALLGYGHAGRFMHAPLIAAEPGLELCTIVTANPERAAQAGTEHPEARVVAGADEVWAGAGQLDLVVLATPNRTHLPLALAAIGAGLAVVVDKPLAGSVADGRRIIEAAEAARVVLTVFHNRRWDGDLLTVRRLLDSGALGPVQRFESRFERHRPAVKPGWRELGAPEEAGGLLHDLGSHLVDQAVLLFGPVTRVYAELDRRRAGVEVEDDAFVALTHAGGQRSHLWMSSVAADLGPRVRVLGDRAAYVKYGLDGQEDALRAEGRPELPGWGEEPPERWGRLAAGEQSEPVPTEPGDWPAFYRGVVAAVAEGAPPPVGPAEVLVVLELLEAARRSAVQGQVVDVQRPT
jgi:predicted dehydrogenase